MASRRVVVVVFDGIQTLDVSGPVEVFSTANRQTGRDLYRIEVVSLDGTAVIGTSGLSINADRSFAEVRGDIDTMVVAGGDGIAHAIGDRRFVAGVGRLARRARRITSVCSGAFALAEAGLLDGRRCTTHWSACETLADRYPAVEVDPDPIFVRDGNVFTSAGVTAGMDLALALVEDDHDTELALTIARRLVLFLRRPGTQSQFSAQLAGQLASRDPLRVAQQHIAEYPDADLSVAALARHVGMSGRNFARCFRDEIGLTPARYVEQARLETARRLLEETEDGVEVIARRSGFGSAETMRRVFVRVVRTNPNDYRRRFRASAA
ncbi:MAG: GlxA family transcriptional regulator [Acidimicrobiales bacterium]|nr:GlxA family transcriptional regulator [Acidimicrobiales bacterium]